MFKSFGHSKYALFFCLTLWKSFVFSLSNTLNRNDWLWKFSTAEENSEFHVEVKDEVGLGKQLPCVTCVARSRLCVSRAALSSRWSGPPVCAALPGPAAHVGIYILPGWRFLITQHPVLKIERVNRPFFSPFEVSTCNIAQRNAIKQCEC